MDEGRYINADPADLDEWHGVVAQARSRMVETVTAITEGETNKAAHLLTGMAGNLASLLGALETAGAQRSDEAGTLEIPTPLLNSDANRILGNCLAEALVAATAVDGERGEPDDGTGPCAHAVSLLLLQTVQEIQAGDRLNGTPPED